MDTNIKLSNYNIVLKKKELSPQFVKDTIETILKDKSQDHDLIISQFPGVLIIGVPSKEVSLTVQDETIVISDNSTVITDSKTEFLSSVIHEINLRIKNKLLLYGFNYMYSIELESADSSSKLSEYLTTSKLIQTGLISEAEGVKLLSFSIEQANPKDKTRQFITTNIGNNKRERVIDYQRNIEQSGGLPTLTELSKLMMKYHTEAVASLQEFLKFMEGKNAK